MSKEALYRYKVESIVKETINRCQLTEGNMYAVSQVEVDDDYYAYNTLEAQGFFGFVDGQVVMLRPGETHMTDKYYRFISDKDTMLLGRIFEVDGDLILVYDYWGDYEGITDIPFKVIRNAFTKTSMQGEKKYYVKAYDSNPPATPWIKQR